MRRKFAALVLGLVVSSSRCDATLVVNAPQPITERVTVQVITAAASNGNNAAPGFGNSTQQATIFGGINAIWAQAGIDVQFKFRLANWNNDFALLGTPGSNNPRPTGDLNTMFTSADGAGLLDPNPLVLNLVLTRIVPGFSQQGGSVSNGLAFVGANGIALWAGATLLTFANGLDVIAKVLAHEIGHNLGLSHDTVNTDNLMYSGGSASTGERLLAAQISTARLSSFSVPIPEPQPMLFFALGALMLQSGRTFRRRKRAAFRHGDCSV